MRLGQLGNCFGIAQQGDCLFESLQVFWTDQHSRRRSIAGHNHALVMMLHSIDELGEPVPH